MYLSLKRARSLSLCFALPLSRSLSISLPLSHTYTNQLCTKIIAQVICFLSFLPFSPGIHIIILKIRHAKTIWIVLVIAVPFLRSFRVNEKCRYCLNSHVRKRKHFQKRVFKKKKNTIFHVFALCTTQRRSLFKTQICNSQSRSIKFNTKNTEQQKPSTCPKHVQFVPNYE